MGSERCHNPLCGNSVGPRVRKKRSFCSPRCKLDTWALKKAASLLADLPAEGKLEVLSRLVGANRNGNQYEINRGNQRKITVGNQCEFNGENHCEFTAGNGHAAPTGGVSSAEVKAYRCKRYPSYRIGRKVRFESGFFQTGDPKLQQLVEGNDYFGVYILPVD